MVTGQILVDISHAGKRFWPTIMWKANSNFHKLLSTAVWQKNRELEAEAAATNKKKDAGEYDVVVRQLQFEMKAKVSRAIFIFSTRPVHEPSGP